jgi:hypothetical protein
MSDKNDDVIEFIEDNDPPPQKPEKKLTAPAFDPFGDVNVSPEDMRVVPPPSVNKPAAADVAPIDVFAGEDVQVATPGADAPAEPPPKSAGGIEVDRVKPRQDLWTCPHCGAKNKPDRDTCRACGKRADEKVVTPIHQNPLVQAAALGVVGFLLVMWFVFGGESMALKPVGAIDTQVRSDNSGGEEISVGKVPFQPEGRIAVAGRDIRAATFVGGDDGVRSILIVLDPQAADDAWVENLRVNWNSSRIKVEHRQDGTVSFAVLHVIDGRDTLPDLTNVSYISVAGQHGEVKRPWSSKVMRRFEDIVVLDDVEVR